MLIIRQVKDIWWKFFTWEGIEYGTVNKTASNLPSRSLLWLRFPEKPANSPVDDCGSFYKRKGKGISWITAWGHYDWILAFLASLRASSPIWASKTSLARTREQVAKPRGAGKGAREARFAWPNRRACSQASVGGAGLLRVKGEFRWRARARARVLPSRALQKLIKSDRRLSRRLLSCLLG